MKEANLKVLQAETEKETLLVEAKLAHGAQLRAITESIKDGDVGRVELEAECRTLQVQLEEAQEAKKTQETQIIGLTARLHASNTVAMRKTSETASESRVEGASRCYWLLLREMNEHMRRLLRNWGKKSDGWMSIEMAASKFGPRSKSKLYQAALSGIILRHHRHGLASYYVGAALLSWREYVVQVQLIQRCRHAIEAAEGRSMKLTEELNLAEKRGNDQIEWAKRKQGEEAQEVERHVKLLLENLKETQQRAAQVEERIEQEVSVAKQEMKDLCDKEWEERLCEMSAVFQKEIDGADKRARDVEGGLEQFAKEIREKSGEEMREQVYAAKMKSAQILASRSEEIQEKLQNKSREMTALQKQIRSMSAELEASNSAHIAAEAKLKAAQEGTYNHAKSPEVVQQREAYAGRLGAFQKNRASMFYFRHWVRFTRPTRGGIITKSQLLAERETRRSETLALILSTERRTNLKCAVHVWSKVTMGRKATGRLEAKLQSAIQARDKALAQFDRMRAARLKGGEVCSQCALSITPSPPNAKETVRDMLMLRPKRSQSAGRATPKASSNPDGSLKPVEKPIASTPTQNTVPQNGVRILWAKHGIRWWPAKVVTAAVAGFDRTATDCVWVAWLGGTRPCSQVRKEHTAPFLESFNEKYNAELTSSEYKQAVKQALDQLQASSNADVELEQAREETRSGLSMPATEMFQPSPGSQAQEANPLFRAMSPAPFRSMSPAAFSRNSSPALSSRNNSPSTRGRQRSTPIEKQERRRARAPLRSNSPGFREQGIPPPPPVGNPPRGAPAKAGTNKSKFGTAYEMRRGFAGLPMAGASDKENRGS